MLMDVSASHGLFLYLLYHINVDITVFMTTFIKLFNLLFNSNHRLFNYLFFCCFSVVFYPVHTLRQIPITNHLLLCFVTSLKYLITLLSIARPMGELEIRDITWMTSNPSTNRVYRNNVIYRRTHRVWCLQ